MSICIAWYQYKYSDMFFENLGEYFVEFMH